MNQQEIKLSDFSVDPDGRLCEVMELGTATFVHILNSVREDTWEIEGFGFSFNPRFISKNNNW